MVKYYLNKYIKITSNYYFNIIIGNICGNLKINFVIIPYL